MKQDNSCIFCQIINDIKPAYKIWQDDRFLAFLDIRAINPGHLLVIPKYHIDLLFDLPEPYYTDIFKVVRFLSEPLNSAMGSSRIGLALEGFGVPHAHIHMIPITIGAGLEPQKAKYLSDQELTDAAQKIAAKLNINIQY